MCALPSAVLQAPTGQAGVGEEVGETHDVRVGGIMCVLGEGSVVGVLQEMCQTQLQSQLSRSIFFAGGA